MFIKFVIGAEPLSGFDTYISTLRDSLHMEDCIAAASENVNLLNIRGLRGNMGLKIDIRKAFDSMD